MADIFISYAQKERDLMLPLKARLEALDITVFVDVDGRLDGMPTFPEALDRGVRQAKAVLGCWTPWALTREWVKNECAIGRDQNKLVAVELAGLTPDEVPAEFYRVDRKYLVGFDPVQLNTGWGMALMALATKFRLWAERNATDPEVAAVLEKAAALEAAAAIERGAAAVPPVIRTPRPEPEPPRDDDAVVATKAFDLKQYVFISYPANIDPALMRSIVRQLLRRELSVWIYDPSPYGFTQTELRAIGRQRAAKDFTTQTLTALEEATCILLLLGASTAGGRFQNGEIELAIKRGRFAAARVGKISYSELPEVLAGSHVPNLFPDEVDVATRRQRVVDLADDIATFMASIMAETSRESAKGLDDRNFLPAIYISHARQDHNTAEALHKELARIRTPRHLIGRKADNRIIPPKLGAIIRDKADLAAGATIGDNVRESMLRTESLVVVCTPAAAASAWVASEIATYIRLGRKDRIFLIVPPSAPAGEKLENMLPEALNDPDVSVIDMREAGGGASGVRRLYAAMIGVPAFEMQRGHWLPLALASMIAVAVAAAAGVMIYLWPR